MIDEIPGAALIPGGTDRKMRIVPPSPREQQQQQEEEATRELDVSQPPPRSSRLS